MHSPSCNLPESVARIWPMSGPTRLRWTSPSPASCWLRTQLEDTEILNSSKPQRHCQTFWMGCWQGGGGGCERQETDDDGKAQYISTNLQMMLFAQLLALLIVRPVLETHLKTLPLLFLKFNFVSIDFKSEPESFRVWLCFRAKRVDTLLFNFHEKVTATVLCFDVLFSRICLLWAVWVCNETKDNSRSLHWLIYTRDAFGFQLKVRWRVSIVTPCHLFMLSNWLFLETAFFPSRRDWSFKWTLCSTCLKFTGEDVDQGPRICLAMWAWRKPPWGLRFFFYLPSFWWRRNRWEPPWQREPARILPVPRGVSWHSSSSSFRMWLSWICWAPGRYGSAQNAEWIFDKILEITAQRKSVYSSFACNEELPTTSQREKKLWFQQTDGLM